MKSFEKAVRKNTIRLSLIALLFIVVLSSLYSSVVFAGSGWYRVNILVAYDEEWRSIAWNKYLYTPEYLAWIFIDDVGYEFYKHQIVFEIVEYVQFDSDDSDFLTLSRLNEVIWECRTVGDNQFTSGHTTQAGNIVHILIAFTDQPIHDGYGRANREVGAVIVEEYTQPAWRPIQEQHTDNILQHELSHLWGCEHHDVDGLDCVLNEHRERQGDLPPCLFTNNWCGVCQDIIASNIGKWGHELSGGGGGGGYGGYKVCYQSG